MSTTNILSRLPVKSIVRFKCVSKSWFALIKSPGFITAHHNRSAQDPSLIMRYYNHNTGNHAGLMLIRSSGTKDYVEMPPYLVGLSCFPRLVGSCNGLVCLDVSICNGSAFVLWNLGTNQFKRLPKPSISELLPPFKRFCMVSLGFGFDPVANDMSLVRIVNFPNHQFLEMRVEVYKKSRGTWKEIAAEIGSCVIYGAQEGVAVKGVLHWMANGVGDLANRRFVVSYDMNREAFSRTVMPEFPPNKIVKALSYNETLALAVYSGFRSISDRLELWVMNETKKWTKEFQIGIGTMYPVGSRKGSEFTMREGHDFLLFDPPTRKALSLRIDGENYTHQVFTYVDTLVDV